MSENKKVKINSPLPRVSPESVGINTGDILNFINTADMKGLDLHSFMMLRDGKVYAEGYYKPYTPTTLQTVYSLSKSFTSFAVGLAVEDGILKLTDRVVSFFPESEYNNENGYMEQMTIKNLLSMSTGQEKEPPFDKISIENFFKITPHEAPGQIFRYNTSATYMLSAILKKKGIDLEEFLEERLLKHLGIEGLRWQRCPKGICYGGFGFSLIPECIAKFGQLLLNKGVWEGKRLISEAYLNEATSKIIRNSDDESQPNDWAQGYGYQFWQCRYNSFRGDGMYGQLCVVSPDKKAVFAVTSYSNDIQGILNVYYDTILTKFHDSEITVSAFNEQSKQFNEVLSGLKVKNDALQKLDFSSFAGKSYEAVTDREDENMIIKFNDNSVHIIQNAFINNNKSEYKYIFEESPKTFYGSYFMSDFNDTAIFTSCGMKEDGTLCFDMAMLELLKFLRIALKFEEDRISIICYDIQPDSNREIFKITAKEK
ncbi:MAG: class beta-lactamase-related serine hydrolase [Clostridia bacterium]|nr:class beta-lactamase-related serine hydrolase [Clostridia bacterium]